MLLLREILDVFDPEFARLTPPGWAPQPERAAAHATDAAKVKKIRSRFVIHFPLSKSDISIDDIWSYLDLL
jgi:hypothetical protein